MKPSEILRKMRKYNWCKGEYYRIDDAGIRFCFNGFIFNEMLGNPEPENGDVDMIKAYGHCGRFLHDVIADTNDSKHTFTWKKKTVIAFLEREGL